MKRIALRARERGLSLESVRWTNFLAAAAFLIIMSSCGLPITAPTDLDFTNYKTGYSIRVRNDASEDLVAFKGRISESTLISAIRANESDWGLKKDPALFSSSGDFPLILITVEQYEANKENLDELSQTPFGRIYAYYNASGDNNAVYEISDRLGGDMTLIVHNTTSFNAELRLNAAEGGETFGYVSAGTLNTSFSLQEGDYYFFPVFRKFNQARGEIFSVYPKYKVGSDLAGQAKFIQLGFSQPYSERSINIAIFLDDIKLSTGSAYIIINNQVSNSDITFKTGSTEMVTSTGIKSIPSSKSAMFQFNMDKLGTGDEVKYASEKEIDLSAYSVGPTVNMKALGSGQLKLEVDKIYTFNVTGQADSITITQGTTQGVDVDGMFNLGE